jgi:hypothetical protein
VAGRAPPAELDAARAKGLTGLGPLAETYPTDPAVLKALLLAYAVDKSGYESAVALAKRMFEADPTTVTDADVKQVLFMAANSVPTVADAALNVMANSMGPHGPDLMFELVQAPSVGKYPRETALRLLAVPEVQKKSSPALKVAIELRALVGCKRRPLFAQARENGDVRSLPYLTPLATPTGCGFFHRQDCYSCLGSRGDLKAAIAAIERRNEQQQQH